MALADSIARNTLAIVLAGGRGSRLAPLTQHVCKPALPFGGVRSIDFSLSNSLNSGVRTIGVPTQYKPGALLAHLANAWGHGATGGAADIQAWRADERAPRLGYRGTADAVYRNLDLIDEAGHCLVLVLAGDHVYKMDYRPILEAHCTKGAAVTVGCVDVPVGDAHHFGVVDIDEDGRVRHFVEKPRSRAELPATTGDSVLASMGVYVFDADFLARTLTADAFTSGSTHDFGADILPRLIANGARVFGYPFRDANAGGCYWRDIGTLGAYWRAHMDLLDPSPPLRLDDPLWPIGTKAQARCTMLRHARTDSGGRVEGSLVAAPQTVAGRVRRSIILEGAEVGTGAEIVESVVMPGATIGPRSYLRGVIVAAGHHVPAGTVIDHTDAAREPLVLTPNDAAQGAMPHAVAR